MSRTKVKRRRYLKPPYIVEFVPERNPPLERRSDLLQGLRILHRHGSAAFVRLHHCELSGDARTQSELVPLLIARLGKPQPKIARSCQRRNAHLRQRVGLARSDQRLVLSKTQASVL